MVEEQGQEEKAHEETSPIKEAPTQGKGQAAVPSVGDCVLYVPHLCHALDQDLEGDFQWHHANPRAPEGSAKQLLPATDVKKLLQVHKGEARKFLEPARPAKLWPGKVTKVNEDGTCDLEVAYLCQHGVQHGMACVPQDPKGLKAHSFKLVPGHKYVEVVGVAGLAHGETGEKCSTRVTLPKKRQEAGQ